MANENFHRANPEISPAQQLKIDPADRQRYPALGFVRLASLADMSLPLAQAYDTRLHPNPQLTLADLTEDLRHLEPADLGRFSALEYANNMQNIFSKICSDAIFGLAVFAPDIPLGHVAPARDWCDAMGNPHHILYPGEPEYRHALRYLDELNTCLDRIFQRQFAPNPHDAGAYNEGWTSAIQEIAEDHQTYLERVRDSSPQLELDPRNEPDATMLALLDKLRTLPGPQSGETTA